MKYLINKVIEALLVLLSIFLLGIFVPTIISLFVIIFNDDTTMKMCITTTPFWIFTVVGWCIAGAYISEVVKNN